MNHRTLGLLGMIGAPMLLSGLLRDAYQHRPHGIYGVLELLYLGGWLCSSIGLRGLRATGDGRAGVIIFIIQVAGLALAAIFSTAEALVATSVIPASATKAPLFFVTDMAWPFSHVLMIVVAIAVLCTGRWRGWQKFTPLLCGIILPLAMLSGALFGHRALQISFGPATAIAFMLLGYAVFTNGGQTEG